MQWTAINFKYLCDVFILIIHPVWLGTEQFKIYLLFFSQVQTKSDCREKHHILGAPGCDTLYV